MTFNFTFTTREEYLQQKKEWFVAYKQAIQNIRKCKHQLKDAQRGKIGWSEVGNQSRAQKELDDLISARWESRREANRQYHAEKTIKA